jgi:hypothetical protein
MPQRRKPMRALAFLALMASPAYGLEINGPLLMPPQNAPCAPYEDVSKALADKYGEAVMERGLSQAGVMVEWWGNSATGTWTILTITAAGVACIVQAGELFETLPVGADA